MNVANIRFDFADSNSPVQKSIELVLSTILPVVEAEIVTVFMIHGSLMTNDLSNWEPRLATALRTYGVEDPLVLIGLLRPEQAGLGQSATFQALTARARVRYVDVILNFLPGIIQAISEVRQARAVPLTPMQRLRELRLSISETELRYIRHDLKYALPGSEREKQLLERARKMGLSGDDRGLREALEMFDEIPAELVCRGQRFAGLFCDVEGTLLDKDGAVNPDVLSVLRDAETQGRAVTIWTGGNPAYVARKMQQAGLSYQVVRKGDFAGGIVEEAIDDDLGDLCRQYGITAERTLDHRNLAH